MLPRLGGRGGGSSLCRAGAGKSTLLNMLTLEKGSGIAEGDVTLNGQGLTPSISAKHCSYVPQFDQQWTFLTTKEHLECALHGLAAGVRSQAFGSHAAVTCDGAHAISTLCP